MKYCFLGGTTAVLGLALASSCFAQTLPTQPTAPSSQPTVPTQPTPPNTMESLPSNPGADGLRYVPAPVIERQQNRVRQENRSTEPSAEQGMDNREGSFREKSTEIPH